MLDVDEGSEATGLLGLSDHGESERGFTGGLGAVDFNNPSPRKAARAEGLVNEEIPSRDHGDLRSRVFAHPQDGPFSVVFLNLLNGEVEISSARFGYFIGNGFG
jgi:hypothetical protein